MPSIIDELMRQQAMKRRQGGMGAGTMGVAPAVAPAPPTPLPPSIPPTDAPRPGADMGMMDAPPAAPVSGMAADRISGPMKQGAMAPPPPPAPPPPGPTAMAPGGSMPLTASVMPSAAPGGAGSAISMMVQKLRAQGIPEAQALQIVLGQMRRR